MTYETIKQNYLRGLWTLQMVGVAFEKGIITSTQYEEITGSDVPPEHRPDYALIDNQWVKVSYSKKEFMLWAGVDKMTAVNAAIAAGNVLVGTVKDLLMAADYIDIRDPDTIQMINLLASTQGGDILIQDDVERILAGKPYQPEESEAEE